MTFKDIAIGSCFLDRHGVLHQKTSRRCARRGAGPVYQYALSSYALSVPYGTTCPYMERNFHGKQSAGDGAAIPRELST